MGGRNPANQLIGGFSHYLHGFTHLKLCRISSINSTSGYYREGQGSPANNIQ